MPRVADRVLKAVLVSAATLALSGCGGVLSPEGPVGAGEKMILLDALELMLVIVIPTIVAILAFAWWFRASNPRAKRLPDWEFSGAIEIVVWAIPLLTVLFLGGMTWIASFQLDPYRPLPSQTKPLEVQVVSLDWKWLFIYPDQQVASVNELVVPAGAPVHFTLTSASVMNAFFVPRLGSMIYTMNGMATQLNLQADRPGDFPGLSSHFSGDGFSGMHFVMHARSPADFAAWVAGVRAGGPVLDAPAYDSLAKQSSNVAPFTYRAAAPGLFQAVLTPPPPPPPPGDRAGPGPGERRRSRISQAGALRCWAS